MRVNMQVKKKNQYYKACDACTSTRVSFDQQRGQYEERCSLDMPKCEAQGLHA